MINASLRLDSHITELKQMLALDKTADGVSSRPDLQKVVEIVKEIFSQGISVESVRGQELIKLLKQVVEKNENISLVAKSTLGNMNVSNLKKIVDFLEMDKSTFINNACYLAKSGNFEGLAFDDIKLIAARFAKLGGDEVTIHELYKAAISHVQNPDQKAELMLLEANQAKTSQRVKNAINIHGKLPRGKEQHATPTIHLDNMDSNMVKAGRVGFAVRKINREDHVVVNFQLTSVGRKQLAAGTANLESTAQKISSEKRDQFPSVKTSDGQFEYYSSKIGGAIDKNVKIVGGTARIIDFPGLGKVIVANPNANHHALQGEVRIELHSNIKPEDAGKALNKIFSYLGIGEVTSEARGTDQERMKMMAMFQILYPDKVSKLMKKNPLELSFSVLRNEMIKLVPELKGNFDDQLNKMYLQRIGPGESQWAFGGMADKMRQAGAVGLMCGVRQVEHAVSMLKGGAMSSCERFSDHRVIQGASSLQDLKTGGAKYVFTRVITKAMVSNKERVGNDVSEFPFSGSVQILYDLDVTERVCYMYSSDKYGSKDPNLYEKRKGIAEVTQKMKASDTDNELMVKGRIPPQKIRGMVVQDEETKSQLISQLIGNGLVDSKGNIMGKPVGAFVQVRPKFNENDWKKPDDWKEPEENMETWLKASLPNVAHTEKATFKLGTKAESAKNIAKRDEIIKKNQLACEESEAATLLENQSFDTPILFYNSEPAAEGFYLMRKGEDPVKLNQIQEEILLKKGLDGLKELEPNIKTPDDIEKEKEALIKDIKLLNISSEKAREMLKNQPKGTQVLCFSSNSYCLVSNDGITPLSIEQRKLLVSKGIDALRKVLKFKTPDQITKENKINLINSEHKLIIRLTGATHLLQQQPKGTILLRFSPSQDAYVLVSDYGKKEEKLTNEQYDVLLSEGINGLKKLQPTLTTPLELTVANVKSQTNLTTPIEVTGATVKSKPTVSVKLEDIKSSAITVTIPLTDVFPKLLTSVKVVKAAIGGSTGAKLVQSDDVKFIQKTGSNPTHMIAEYNANKAYKALGVSVPEVTLYNNTTTAQIQGKTETPLKPVMLAQFIEGGVTLDKFLEDPKVSLDDKEEVKKKLQDHFVADCLLANWDVIGLQRDNILVTPEGTPVRIDNGCVFEFRAQGGLKSGGFADTVSELKTMRDIKINPRAAEIYGGITDAQIIKQIDGINAKAEALFAAVPEKYHVALQKRIAFLNNYKQELIGKQHAANMLQQDALNNGSKTVVFDKNFACESLSLHGIPLKSAAPEEYAKIPDIKISDEPDANGKPGEYKGIFAEAQKKGLKVSAGVIIMEPDGRVWIYEPKGHFGGYKNTFPKGTQEKGLSLQQTAIKEAFEESGLQVEITGFLMDQQKTTSMTRYYVARRVGGDPSDAHWEASNVKLVPTQDLSKYLNTNLDKAIAKKIMQT